MTNQTSYFIYLAELVATVLLGALLFFAIIGVFGLRFAIAGLVLSVIGTTIICGAFHSKGTEV